MEEKPKIQVGYRIGKLTVEQKTDQRLSGYMVWKCRCECGSEILLDTRRLQRGLITDCGCITKVNPGQKDLTGMRFGKLICIEPSDQKNEKGSGSIWKCRCDCGNDCLAVSRQLIQGYKKSCGCLGHPPLKNFIGKRFSQLTVIAYIGKRDGMHRWKCRCDCGKETIVGQTLLQTGKTKSCGCLQSIVIKKNLELVDGTSVTILRAVQKHRFRNNTSGHTGVYKDKNTNKWIAQITFKRKTYSLGSYDKIEDAIEAREKGESMHRDFLKKYYAEHPERKVLRDDIDNGV